MVAEYWLTLLMSSTVNVITTLLVDSVPVTANVLVVPVAVPNRRNPLPTPTADGTAGPVTENSAAPSSPEFGVTVSFTLSVPATGPVVSLLQARAPASNPAATSLHNERVTGGLPAWPASDWSRPAGAPPRAARRSR